MPKIYEMHYIRFYEVVEEKSRIWTVKKLLERINKMMVSNLELTENGLRVLIRKQQKFHIFRCVSSKLGKATTYYVFRKCLPN